MKNKLNLFSVGLPDNEDLSSWSKDLIRQRFETTAITSDLVPFVSGNSNYELNENMVALYDFHQRPIRGKYQTVIFDKKDGIILCQKNSRQLINHLLKDQMILERFYKRSCKKNLAFTIDIQFL